MLQADTSLRVVDGGLFTGGYVFRHRNNSSPDNGGKPNGIRSHRHPADQASASCAPAKPQSSWWPSLKRTISERSPGEDSRLLLSWCGLCVGAAVTLRSTPPVKSGPRWVYPGHRPQRQEKSRHQRPKHGPRHVLLGHRGSTYYWTAGTRLPPEKQTQKSPPCQGSAAKNELVQLKSFKFWMRNPN